MLDATDIRVLVSLLRKLGESDAAITTFLCDHGVPDEQIQEGLA